MKINKKTVKKIVKFQKIVKYKINCLQNYNLNLNFIYNGICSIIGNIEKIYKNSLIKKEKYNTSIEKVESIFTDYKKIPLQLSISDLKNENKFKENINNIFNRLASICNEVASSSCTDTISFIIKK